MIVSHAKKQGAELPKDVSRKIVENISKDVGLLINEVDKYCAASEYDLITYEIVDRIGVKTVEASVFDMIDLICRKKPVKAIEKLNNLFELRTKHHDESSRRGVVGSNGRNIPTIPATREITPIILKSTLTAYTH
jgi:DNA polymerase III delta subunit